MTKLTEMENKELEYTTQQRKEVKDRMKPLSNELAARQESINVLNGKLSHEITSFRETIARILDKDLSLGEKIRTLFREQGITIASILTAIGMAIGVIVQAILPKSVPSGSGVDKQPPQQDD